MPSYLYVPLSHLRSKGKASAYILYCTGSGMLTRYMHCGQCNIFLYCTDHSAYISTQNHSHTHTKASKKKKKTKSKASHADPEKQWDAWAYILRRQEPMMVNPRKPQQLERHEQQFDICFPSYYPLMLQLHKLGLERRSNFTLRKFL